MNGQSNGGKYIYIYGRREWQDIQLPSLYVIWKIAHIYITSNNG